ncbi:TIGR03936 family radical SAM-associated protein [Candidatus Margulisiibacteriota bacterium]
MQRIRLTYSKEDNMKFISHSELIRAFEKAIRRADIPVAFSQGFNPHMKIDFGIPLQIGITSGCEIMDITTEKKISPDTAEIALNRTLPPGLKISEATEIGHNRPSIQSHVTAAVYRIILKEGQQPDQKVKDILEQTEIQIIRRTKSGEKKVDIRPMIKSLKLVDNKLEATLQSSSSGTLKANEFLALLEGFDIESIRRIELLT